MSDRTPSPLAPRAEDARAGDQQEQERTIPTLLRAAERVVNAWNGSEPTMRAAIDALAAELTTVPASGQLSDDTDRLDGIGWFGCMTGDCPHQTQAECDAAILALVREVVTERGSSRDIDALICAECGVPLGKHFDMQGRPGLGAWCTTDPTSLQHFRRSAPRV